MVIKTKKTYMSAVKLSCIVVLVLFLLLPDTILTANNLPTASLTANPPSGPYPLRVQFQANADDPDGDRLTYEWDFGDPTSGDNTSTEENPMHIYQYKGMYKVTLAVSDQRDEVTFSRTVRGGEYLIDFFYGDFDNSGDVDMSDVQIFVDTWVGINGNDGYNSDADLNHDDKVDFKDFAEFNIDWGPTHVAVIIGISDYGWLSYLENPDEDATDWYNYFNNMGYEGIFILGDTHISNYPEYYGLATEYNIKNKLEAIVNLLDDNDILSIIFSGHGGGGGYGNSYFAAWDSTVGFNGEDGDLWDGELADIIENAVARVFVFFDADKSGGMLDNFAIMSNASRVYATSSCKKNGFRNDMFLAGNGAWTYYFLEAGLIGHFLSYPKTYVEDCFTWADSQYNPPSSASEPVEFDGKHGYAFILW